jgi:hypothetical protein
LDRDTGALTSTVNITLHNLDGRRMTSPLHAAIEFDDTYIWTGASQVGFSRSGMGAGGGAHIVALRMGPDGMPELEWTSGAAARGQEADAAAYVLGYTPDLVDPAWTVISNLESDVVRLILNDADRGFYRIRRGDAD